LDEGSITFGRTKREIEQKKPYFVQFSEKMALKEKKPDVSR